MKKHKNQYFLQGPIVRPSSEVFQYAQHRTAALLHLYFGAFAFVSVVLQFRIDPGMVRDDLVV